MRRYEIEAKRKNTKEDWSAWTSAEEYYRAKEHEAHVCELGYEGRTVVHPEVREIWAILGDDSGDVKVTTDKIFDAGFRKASVIREETERRVTREVSRAILTEIADAFEKYGGQYGMKQKIIELEEKFGVISCADCKYFVGCEAVCGGRLCDLFEVKSDES